MRRARCSQIMLMTCSFPRGGNSTSLSGIGLRHPHVDEVLSTRPEVGWFEVHSENYMMDDGPRKEKLLAVRQNYPLSLHGVALSLGSADGLDMDHVNLLKRLIDQLDPCLVSDHLSWGRHDQIYLPDLLPVPYTRESLDIFCSNLDKVQEFLGRCLLVENPSSYLLFPESTMEEHIFLKEIARRTGCKILLDVNNIYVACHNHGWDPYTYINAFTTDEVAEIHLAGHSASSAVEGLLIDTHNTYVQGEVWSLYRHTICHLGPKHTLIEWDADLPDFSELLKEVERASFILEKETIHDHYSHAKAAKIR